MVLLGWVVIVVGIVATLAGIAGAIVQMMKDLQNRQGKSLSSLPTDFVDAIRLLIQALIAAPVWLVLLIFGFALIVWGGTLIR